MRGELKTCRMLDDRAIPNGMEVGGFAELDQLDLVAAAVVVIILSVQWLMDVADEVHHPFQRLQAVIQGCRGIGQDRGEIDYFADDAIAASAVAGGIVARSRKWNVDKMPACRIPPLRPDFIRPR